eukprot:gene25635-30961_t
MGPNVGNLDIVLLKYASNGTRLWTRISGTAGADVGYGVAFDAGTGGVYVTGQVSGSLNGEAYTAGNGVDIILLKYTSSGTVVWTRIVGTNGTDIGHAVVVDSSTGNVYVTGQAHVAVDTNGIVYVVGQYSASAPNSMGSTDLFFLRLTSDGQLIRTDMVLWTTNYL